MKKKEIYELLKNSETSLDKILQQEMADYLKLFTDRHIGKIEALNALHTDFIKKWASIILELKDIGMNIEELTEEVSTFFEALFKIIVNKMYNREINIIRKDYCAGKEMPEMDIFDPEHFEKKLTKSEKIMKEKFKMGDEHEQ